MNPKGPEYFEILVWKVVYNALLFIRANLIKYNTLQKVPTLDSIYCTCWPAACLTHHEQYPQSQWNCLWVKVSLYVNRGSESASKCILFYLCCPLWGPVHLSIAFGLSQIEVGRTVSYCLFFTSLPHYLTVWPSISCSLNFLFYWKDYCSEMSKTVQLVSYLNNAFSNLIISSDPSPIVR